MNATDDIAITDAEWRQFQSIPDQGYSHRFWIDHLIAGRVAVAFESAESEIVRLRGIIAEVKDKTRYTLNSRWALNGIINILAKATLTAEEGKR